MGEEDLKECVELAGEFKRGGRAVVGMDLCGDPSVSWVVEALFARGVELSLESRSRERLNDSLRFVRSPRDPRHPTLFDSSHVQGITTIFLLLFISLNCRPIDRRNVRLCSLS